jgi:hypothetical protein
MEQNRQSIRNLLLDLENSFRAGPKGGFPVENHFAVVTAPGIVAAHGVGALIPVAPACMAMPSCSLPPGLSIVQRVVVGRVSAQIKILYQSENRRQLSRL